MGGSSALKIKSPSFHLRCSLLGCERPSWPWASSRKWFLLAPCASTGFGIKAQEPTRGNQQSALQDKLLAAATFGGVAFVGPLRYQGFLKQCPDLTCMIRYLLAGAAACYAVCRSYMVACTARHGYQLESNIEGKGNRAYAARFQVWCSMLLTLQPCAPSISLQ